MDCMRTSLVLIARVIFLLEHGYADINTHAHTHTHTVTDATDRHTHASDTAGMGNNGTYVGHYLVGLVVPFTFTQLIINCLQHFRLLFFCFQVFFVSVDKQHRIMFIRLQRDKQKKIKKELIFYSAHSRWPNLVIMALHTSMTLLRIKASQYSPPYCKLVLLNIFGHGLTKSH